MDQLLTRVACIGECMIELEERATAGCREPMAATPSIPPSTSLGSLRRRLRHRAGRRPFSEEMLAGWRREGVGTAHVRSIPARRHVRRERSFFYWRDWATPTRALRSPGNTIGHPGVDPLRPALPFRITLSLYGERHANDGLLTPLQGGADRLACDAHPLARPPCERCLAASTAHHHLDSAWAVMPWA